MHRLAVVGMGNPPVQKHVVTCQTGYENTQSRIIHPLFSLLFFSVKRISATLQTIQNGVILSVVSIAGKSNGIMKQKAFLKSAC